jgi:type I restriction enzyme M protein
VNYARIEWGDTLRNPLLVEDDKLMKFDVVVANPPFSLDKWGAEGSEKDKYRRFHRGVPPKSVGDYAFISHMIETANQVNGRVGVVVPNGVLFRSGAEGKIRQKLIEENLLDAVLGLPTGLFYGTGIPGVILVFKKSKVNKTVLFIDASKEFLAGTPQNKLHSQYIEKISTVYHQRETLNNYSYLATYEELKANDFNLNIARYVDTLTKEEIINVSALQHEINRLDQEIKTAQDHVSSYLQELGLYE